MAPAEVQKVQLMDASCCGGADAACLDDVRTGTPHMAARWLEEVVM